MYKVNKEKLTKARERRLKRENKGSDEKYAKNLANEVSFNNQDIIDLSEEGAIEELLKKMLAAIIEVEKLRIEKLKENPFENQIEIIRSEQYIQAATLLINRQ